MEFDLTGEPAASGGGHEALIDDNFSAGSIDLGTWEVADPGSHFSLGGGGLTLRGGNGFDGQTTLTANDPLELGGTLVVELDNVVLTGASDGVIAGLYSGATATANLSGGLQYPAVGREHAGDAVRQRGGGGQLADGGLGACVYAASAGELRGADPGEAAVFMRW